MMKKIMSFVEVDTLNRNINMIEARLGYKAPRNLLDYDELKDGILSLEEVDTTARNIELINMRRGSNRVAFSIIDYWPLLFTLIWVLAAIIGMLS